METCADMQCTCGKHECPDKSSRNPIKPMVYQAGLPQTETQEMLSHFGGGGRISHRRPSFASMNKKKSCHRDDAPNSVLKHPSHTHVEYQNYAGQPGCPDVVGEVHVCDHGPYFPRTSPYPRPVCHPDRPTITGILKTIVAEKKECSKCTDVFKDLDREREKKSPPVPLLQREEEPLQECHKIDEIACNPPLECCCKCCTCRGCPTCVSVQSTQHPCHFFPLVRNCCAKTRGCKNIATCL